ncbi:hypothetical protein RAJCM14343_1765 [Rhodococcus aetherivorans]|uniref:Uncharacterized protein n=1 Tax=Rhodococcus aetherivorans TaxID=191292 RepID=A0ABQ0YIZ0_9NOCA|nr:hypothetical protein [Rhodococcus aetherivorans]KDE11514.1 hypothetical protein N505_0125175 [Rhodococcus aetherivorans]NGP29146.1 hypothetical protein [Rhodococcus aetherivorans]GES36513.1 hypothetical protein RAJCM14343_1765 [Rhodococcus aetherivorans]
MSGRRADAPGTTALLDTLIARLSPTGTWSSLAGTLDAIELVIEAARGTVLAHTLRAVHLEVTEPRPEMWIGGRWPDSEGFYLATMAARFEQLLDSCEAVAALHRAGNHRGGWAVLGQAGDTLERLWMLTETLVFDQPRDEARRCAHAWYAFADAYRRLTPGTPVTVHPFDAALSGDVGEDEDTSLGDGRQHAPTRAKDLVAAIDAGVRLTQVYLPAKLQLDPGLDAGGVHTAGVGIDSPPMSAAQLHLALDLIHTAAVSVDAAVKISLTHRHR